MFAKPACSLVLSDRRASSSHTSPTSSLHQHNFELTDDGSSQRQDGDEKKEQAGDGWGGEVKKDQFQLGRNRDVIYLLDLMNIYHSVATYPYRISRRGSVRGFTFATYQPAAPTAIVHK
uniref:DNA-directed DNA polymerase n=1 Tax=Panagrellus redivivus TaxID=6233 RepID=A0A7E4UWH2_PANRE